MITNLVMAIVGAFAAIVAVTIFRSAQAGRFIWKNLNSFGRGITDHIAYIYR